MLFLICTVRYRIILFLCVRYGLAKAPVEEQVLDLPSGNFNTGLIRLNCLVGKLTNAQIFARGF